MSEPVGSVGDDGSVPGSNDLATSSADSKSNDPPSDSSENEQNQSSEIACAVETSVDPQEIATSCENEESETLCQQEELPESDQAKSLCENTDERLDNEVSETKSDASPSGLASLSSETLQKLNESDLGCRATESGDNVLNETGEETEVTASVEKVANSIKEDSCSEDCHREDSPAKSLDSSAIDAQAKDFNSDSDSLDQSKTSAPDPQTPEVQKKNTSLESPPVKAQESQAAELKAKSPALHTPPTSKTYTPKSSPVPAKRQPSPEKAKPPREATAGDGSEELIALQSEVTRLRREVTEAGERLAAHDASAKKTIMSLQNDMRGRLDNLGRLCEENRREKEAMVLKYAEAERKTMDVQKRVKDLEGRLREAMREREGLTKQGRVLRQEKDRMQQQYDAKSAEVATLEKELLQSKDSASSVDMKVKWHQNKLKEELDKHKETKRRLEEAQKALRNAKEETETIRANCQQIVRQYQESEEMRSNTLDAQLKQKESELKQTQAENYVQQEVHQKALKDLEQFRKQAREATAELRTLRDKVKCLEAERMCQEESAAQAKERAGRMKQQRDQLAERLRGLEAGAAEAAERAVELEKLRTEATAAAEARTELEAEVERAQGRESELLEFTQRLSDRNAALQAETLSQRSRLEELGGELTASAAALEASRTAASETESQLAAEREALAKEVERLSTALAEKTRSSEELSVLLADEQNAIRMLKKKHAANMKDLTRQLAAAQRKIEAGRSPLGGLALQTEQQQQQQQQHQQQQSVGGPANGEASGLNHTTSPASSISSLDLQTGSAGAMAVCVDGGGGGGAFSGGASDGLLDPTLSAPPEIKMIMPDRQALIDKIVRLQRQNARHNEKMDFLQEHVAQLTEQLKKKNRLLQHFILREEAGSVTPEDFDINKATLARKGGIMASVYSTHAADQGMTLDLSLEITKKLQAVLEDTLLKNITLKENLNTLGEEISRLSRENRQLQLNAPSPT